MDNSNYQDLVIKNGKLVGAWDTLYKEHLNPWDQSSDHQMNSISRLLTKFFCEKLRNEFSASTTLEVGCGFAWLTEHLHNHGFKARGTDISQVCISKTAERNSELDLHVAKFNEEKHLLDYNPDIVIMSQVSWYVLDEIKDFLVTLKKLASYGKPKFLIHTLSLYPEGVQRFGTEYFTDLPEMKSFFGLEYIFSSTIETIVEGKTVRDSMFVARL